MKNRTQDLFLGSFFLALTIAFIALAMNNRAFFDWVFERHHNQWSWYLRPLFLLPFCFFAYKKSFTGMMISVFALFTSMFWFPKPDLINKNVVDFLAFEKDYLYGEWTWNKGLLTLTIPISFIALGLAFWKRSLLHGPSRHRPHGNGQNDLESSKCSRSRKINIDSRHFRLIHLLRPNLLWL